LVTPLRRQEIACPLPPKTTNLRALPFEAEGYNQIHALQQQPYSIASSDPQITSGEESIA
jgi:hypothetical protein